MLLLLTDALVLSLLLLTAFFVISRVVKNYKQSQIEAAIFRQKVAEDLAKRVDILDVEQMKLNEKKVNDKLNGLH